MWQSQPFCQRFGEQRCLIVPALPFSLAMQRYWHYDVGCQSISFSVHYFGEPLRKPSPQRLDLLEFQ